MKCFNHHQQEAVGVCKNCLKGICAECATDIGGGITCSDVCEKQARETISLVKSSVNAQKDFKKGGAYLGPLFFIFMGLGFIGFGIYQKSFGDFGYLFGSLFCIFGILMLIFNHRHASRKEHNN